ASTPTRSWPSTATTRRRSRRCARRRWSGDAERLPVVEEPGCFDIAVVGAAAGRGAYFYGAGEPLTMPVGEEKEDSMAVVKSARNNWPSSALTVYERSPLCDEREKAVILFAERLTRGAAPMRDRALEELRKHFSEDQIVELTLVICAANFTNRFNDGLRVEPD